MVLRRSADGLTWEIPEARLWGTILIAMPVALALLLQARPPLSPGCWSWSGAAFSALPSP
jgi:hypothetical protein